MARELSTPLGVDAGTRRSLSDLSRRVGPGPWVPLTLQNGWAAWGGDYATPRYRVVTNGLEFNGLAATGTVTAATVIAEVPFLFAFAHTATVNNNNAAGFVEVTKAGALIVRATAAGFVDLKGLGVVPLS